MCLKVYVNAFVALLQTLIMSFFRIDVNVRGRQDTTLLLSLYKCCLLAQFTLLPNQLSSAKGYYRSVIIIVDFESMEYFKKLEKVIFYYLFDITG